MSFITAAAGPSRVTRAHTLVTFRRASHNQSGPKLAFAFDIDGVLKQGSHVLPQAKRALQRLSGVGPEISESGIVPFLLMTNGGGVTEAQRLASLSKDFEIDLAENQLVQSHTSLRDYVGKYRDEPVLVIGGVGDAGRRIAESYGLRQAYILQDLVAWRQSVWDRYVLTDEEKSFVKRDIDFSNVPLQAIFVIHDNGLDWALAIQVITELLTSDHGRMGTERYRDKGVSDGKEIHLVLTNPDIIWSNEYTLPRFGMGAFRLALEAVYKDKTGCPLPYEQFGKPHTATYEFAEKMLRRHLESRGEDPDQPLSVYMVGDNPESDIAGANAHGWSSMLVRTGVFRGGQPKYQPTQIVDDVEQAIDWAIERESSR
ncbi:HAD-like domain-containing protein [Kockovaella imperatae]|uniref:HAD-like domain-containing protein n=1 Tax=Kockovaella imperatae TaxID=4999 RepID=A0A1Y1UM64_9TREE|nr:HAD-like domain-containing protein [Kockovaella imperatae]ORX38584.1 HAD-like domain-containing protein [Kockovaella imperatae]